MRLLGFGFHVLSFGFVSGLEFRISGLFYTLPASRSLMKLHHLIPRILQQRFFLLPGKVNDGQDLPKSESTIR